MAKNNKQIQFLFLPPHSEITKSWQLKLQDTFDNWNIKVPNTREEALIEIIEADAIFGTLDPEMLSQAKNLKWIQAPAAAPPAGYYFDELTRDLKISISSEYSSTISYLKPKVSNICIASSGDFLERSLISMGLAGAKSLRLQPISCHPRSRGNVKAFRVEVRVIG